MDTTDDISLSEKSVNLQDFVAVGMESIGQWKSRKPDFPTLYWYYYISKLNIMYILLSYATSDNLENRTEQ